MTILQFPQRSPSCAPTTANRPARSMAARAPATPSLGTGGRGVSGAARLGGSLVGLAAPLCSDCGRQPVCHPESSRCVACAERALDEWLERPAVTAVKPALPAGGGLASSGNGGGRSFPSEVARERWLEFRQDAEDQP